MLSLRHFAEERKAVRAFEVIDILVSTEHDALKVAEEAIRLHGEPTRLIDRLSGLTESLLEEWDGVVVDYNAYKVQNGSSAAISMPDVSTKNGYILTNTLDARPASASWLPATSAPRHRGSYRRSPLP